MERHDEHKELLGVLLAADDAYAPEGSMWPQLATAILAAGYRKPTRMTDEGRASVIALAEHLDKWYPTHEPDIAKAALATIKALEATP